MFQKRISKNQISEDQSHQKLKLLHFFDIKMGRKSILLVIELQ